MPYRSTAELPRPVQEHLPRAAQEIYMEAFNSAWEQYASRADREAVAHKVAWTAVKTRYRKRGDRWTRK